MEKKTIGQFIAVLRKANGMTQKDLAEKLNVSDKAVSRWERDECAPDLSLIPVIAEIFDVTADELLRGERKNTEQTADITEEKISVKSTKQVERLLAKSKTGMTIGSIISLGIAVVGLLVALLCNFAFNRSYLGFFIGCVFFLGAVACLIIFHLLARTSIQGGEIEGMENAFAETKQFFFETTAKTAMGILLMFAATLPLFTEGDAYWGLTGEYYFKHAGLIVGILLVCCLVLLILYKRKCDKERFPKMSEREQTVYTNNRSLQNKTFKRVLACVLITFVLQAVFQVVPLKWLTFTKPTIFTSTEEFVAHMEQYVEFYSIGYDGYGYHYEESEMLPSNVISNGKVDIYIKEDLTATEPIDPEETDMYYEKDKYVIYTAEDGTIQYTPYVLGADTAYTEEDIIATYTLKNQAVYEWYAEYVDGEPVYYVTDASAIWRASRLFHLINTGLYVLYGIYALSGIIYYFSKRERV